MLVGSAVSGGAHRGWPLALSLTLVALAVAASCLAALREAQVVWRRTALDAPLLACLGLVIAQLVVSNRQLVAWALMPPAASEAFPSAPLLVGTVAPSQTFSSLILFLAYAAVYYLVVHQVDERHDLGRLVRLLLILGGVLAFVGLIDYLSGESWIFAWREEAFRGRLTASFVNPDHFATWLAMLICLGGGYVMAGRPRWDGFGARDLLSSRQIREEALKRYVPFVALGVMLLAAVFTLSRGGIVGMLAALLVLGALLRTAGRIRSSLIMVAALVIVALAYSAWIGMAPLLSHVGTSGVGLAQRMTQYRASVPMLRDFPILGVGLGAYRAIYPRYQPLAHDPAGVYYPYAHSDLLQFVIETGAMGFAILAWAMWRGWRDLVGAHCWGRGACPVGAGEGEGARRGDPFGVPIAMGAIAGLVAAIVHSGVDFPLRIPANGFLAAALLGIATVALHTRFTVPDSLLLSERRHVQLRGRAIAVVAGAVAVVAATSVIGYAARAAVLDERIAAYRAAPAPERAQAILDVNANDPRGLVARAAARLEQGMALGWRTDGNARAEALVGDAIDDFRRALRASPTEPTYHERLASALAARAMVRRDAHDVADAAAHYRRAIALAPENTTLRLALFRFAFSQRPVLIDEALEAARGAVARDPAALERVLDEVSPVGLTDEQWLALVPATPAARLRLAMALETRALLRPATTLARAAAALSPAKDEEAATRWLLARLLVLQGDVDGGLREIVAAMTRDQRNPELYLAYADTLRARGDPRALDAYRAAVAAAPAPVRRTADGTIDAFPVADASLRALIKERTGRSPLKYRKALASYLGARAFWDQAIPEWMEIVAQAEGDAEAHFGLGSALDAAGKADRALDEYRRAVAIDGRSVFRSRYAQRLWDGHQYFQAIGEWRRIRDREPRNLEARLALARAFVKVGDRGAALGEYQAVLDLDGGSNAVRQELDRARHMPR